MVTDSELTTMPLEKKSGSVPSVVKAMASHWVGLQNNVIFYATKTLRHKEVTKEEVKRFK